MAPASSVWPPDGGERSICWEEKVAFGPSMHSSWNFLVD